MNSISKVRKVSLFLFAVILIVFGFFVLIINVTLLYKGIDAVERKDNSANNAIEIREQSISDKELTSSIVLKKGEEIGKLNIPSLNVALPVYHGTSERELQKGVGHVIGTAFPGEKNNSVLTGHRDTVFRHLGKVNKGDVVEFETSEVIYVYKVRKNRIVDEDDRTVLVPKRKATLTLSTCYPFTYVGPAKQRYILVAELISSKIKRV